MGRVVLDHVSKRFDDVAAVDALTLDVADEEFLVLLGPSGCGKSTALRMIAGLEDPTSGTITIGERVVNDVEAKDRDIAMVFQSYALYPHMSVFDNMAFPLQMAHMKKDEIEKRVKNASRILGLDPFLKRKPRALSGGQRQRVALGRAIVRSPKVFLLDEPLSNLDAKLRGQMRKEIAALHRQLGTTSIYVTHDQTEAMTLGDRIVVMNGGRVEQVGPPMELYRSPANRFVAGFLGSPGMNFVPGRIESDGDGLAFAADGDGLRLRAAPRAGLAPGRPVVLGIRPEDVHLNGSAPASAARATLRLDAAETMGNETIVTLAAGAHEIVARIPPRPLPEPGTMVEAAFDVGRLHFFDSENGDVLGDDDDTRPG